MNGSDLKKEFGDYQTPNQFAETICSLLYNELKLNPEVVIEPTSGLGNFIKAALNTFSTIKKITSRLFFVYFIKQWYIISVSWWLRTHQAVAITTLCC